MHYSISAGQDPTHPLSMKRLAILALVAVGVLRPIRGESVEDGGPSPPPDARQQTPGATKLRPGDELIDVPAANDSSRRPALESDTVLAVAVDGEPVAPAGAAARDYAAGGRLQIIGATSPPRSVTLHWATDLGDETVVGVDWAEQQWSVSFASESLRLIRVQIDGEDGSFAAAPAVTREHPTVDIEIAAHGVVVLDVRSATATNERIPNVSAFLVPDMNSTVRIERNALSRDRELPGYAPFGTAAWRAHRRTPPFVIPPAVIGEFIRVFARGFIDSPSIEVPRSGFMTVLLRPARVLVLAVGEEVPRSSRHDIRVLDASGKVLHRSPGYLGPEPLRIPLEGLDSVVVTITRTAQMGAPFAAQDYAVQLREVGETFFVIPAPGAAQSSEVSSLHVSIESAGAEDPMTGWTVSLRLVDDAELTMMPGEEPYSRLSTWHEVRPEHEYETTLTGICPGHYTFRIDDIDHEQDVVLEPGETCEVDIHLGKLARLTIWRVGADGQRLDAANLGGLLAWREVPPGVDLNSPPRPWVPQGNEILDGPRFATYEEGAWVIESAADRAIEVYFMGPKAFGAEPLRVELETGANEASLRFANLR